MRNFVPFLVAALFAALLVPEAAMAFDARNPASVGVIVMPFETARDEDESLGFLLEDFLKANLERRLRRPVHVGIDVMPALTGRPRDCLVDQACVRLLGGQFNASLVALVVVRRNGDTVTLDVDWYTTGNGLKVTHETTSFASERTKEMLASFSMWVDKLFDPSLRVKAENRAEEGGLLTGSDRDQNARRRDYERGRRKTVSSRRDDFDTGSEASLGTRDDPTAGLRALVADEDDEPKRDWDLPALGDDLVLEEPEADDDLDLDDDGTPPRQRTAPPRRSKPVRETGLVADDARGDALAGYNDAQRAGYGPREVKRFQRSGVDFPTFDAARWAFGKRFHLRVDFAYALGGLTRRYSSLVHVRAPGEKTEEYSWESLGLSFVNPGVRLGFGIAPIDFFEFGVDFGVMYATQALRREFIDNSDPDNAVVSICTEADCPEGATWKSGNSTHVSVDFGVRFFFIPRGRVKPWAGIGGTLLVMSGYEIEVDGLFDHTSRPPSVLFGITPQGGVAISISPFVALNIGVQGTYLAAQGHTSFLNDEYFNGTTPELSGIPEATKEVPHRAEPWMLRVFVGPMILF